MPLFLFIGGIMNIGDRYENGGRILIVDAVLPNGKHLTHVIGKVGDVPQEPEVKQENNKELPQENKSEEPGEETPAETPTEEPKAEEFKCQHCGQICKSKTGLIAHEKACKGNPANK